MKISGVNVYQVKGRGWPKYAWIWVEVNTDEGITGIGESAPVDGVVEALTKLGRKITGENPFNIEKIWNDMFWRVRGYGRKGVAFQAISTLDIGLWDLKAKNEGKNCGGCSESCQQAIWGLTQ